MRPSGSYTVTQIPGGRGTRYLGDDFYVIAVDTLGYGQSDKRLELGLTYAGVAALGP